MYNLAKKFFLSFFIFIFLSKGLLAESVYFIDFTKVLNLSNAGAEAQDKLKSIFLKESEKLKKEEETLKKEESDLTAQKKVLSNEDYKKKVEELRKKVVELQNKKQKSLNSIAKSRADAKNELLKAVNPIIKKYMEENNIRLIIDKESVILGDVNLEITDQIISILNKTVKTIKFN